MKKHTVLISLSLIGLGLISLSCHRKCETPATVVTRPGCGQGFQLTNGDHIRPVSDEGGFCGTTFEPTDIPGDPLNNFQFIEGTKVLIGYDKKGSGGGCTYAKITCLQAVELE